MVQAQVQAQVQQAQAQAAQVQQAMTVGGPVPQLNVIGVTPGNLGVSNRVTRTPQQPQRTQHTVTQGAVTRGGTVGAVNSVNHQLQQQRQQIHAQSARVQQQQAQLQIQEAQRQQAADEARRAAAVLQQQRERDRELQNLAAQQQQQLAQQQKKQDEKYPVMFHWSHGGKEVYVAYSGDNWGQKYRMQRSHGDFSLIMEIEPGVYHYKFIVDNQWRCAPDQKYVRDANGAYSNVLDVRSHSYQQVIEEQKKKRQREREKDKYQYTQNLPKSDHYVQDPPICPIHLHKVILNNEEDLRNEDNTKDIDDHKNEDYIKLKMTSKMKTT